MKLYSLVRGSSVLGYRVVLPELQRAYDINANLFKSYADGVVDLLNLDSIFMHVDANGRWCSEGEETRSEGIKCYLEMSYDTEVANLVSLLRSGIVFGKTEIPYNGASYVLEDVDCSMGIVIVSRKSNFSDSDSIPLMQAVHLVNNAK